MDVLKELEKSSISPRASLSERVVMVLKRFILSDSITVGDRLPPERQMADKLNISRTVLREALNQLIGEGLLERLSPRILRVAEFDRSVLISSMDAVDSGDIEFQDLMQLRYILEVGSIPLICERITAAHLARLQEFAIAHRNELEAGRSGNAADIKFHTCLLQVLDNSVIRQLLPIVEEQIGSFLLREPFRLMADQRGNRSGERVITEHQELINALEKKDANAALETLTRHLAPYFIHLQRHRISQ